MTDDLVARGFGTFSAVRYLPTLGFETDRNVSPPLTGLAALLAEDFSIFDTSELDLSDDFALLD